MKKNNKRKLDEETLQLYGVVEKATEKLMYQISNWKIRMWEIFKHKSVKVEIKLDNMDQVMGIVELNKFNFLKNENEEFW